MPDCPEDTDDHARYPLTLPPVLLSISPNQDQPIQKLSNTLPPIFKI